MTSEAQAMWDVAKAVAGLTAGGLLAIGGYVLKNFHGRLEVLKDQQHADALSILKNEMAVKAIEHGREAREKLQDDKWNTLNNALADMGKDVKLLLQREARESGRRHDGEGNPGS